MPKIQYSRAPCLPLAEIISMAGTAFVMDAKPYLGCVTRHFTDTCRLLAQVTSGDCASRDRSSAVARFPDPDLGPAFTAADSQIERMGDVRTRVDAARGIFPVARSAHPRPIPRSRVETVTIEGCRHLPTSCSVASTSPPFEASSRSALAILARINLLVGGNNSGKTSVLEALAVYSSPLDVAEWSSIARTREVRNVPTAIGAALSNIESHPLAFSGSQDG